VTFDRRINHRYRLPPISRQGYRKSVSPELATDTLMTLRPPASAADGASGQV